MRRGGGAEILKDTRIFLHHHFHFADVLSFQPSQFINNESHDSKTGLTIRLFLFNYTDIIYRPSFDSTPRGCVQELLSYKYRNV